MQKASSVASFGRLPVAGLAILPALLGGCKDDQLKGAQAEVQQTKIKVTMPSVPGFEVPAPHPDGSHSIKELRVQGGRYLKESITVKGFVVWAYDCATAIRQPAEDDVAVAKRIEENPTLCRRPAFYLGATADPPVGRAVWVRQVPPERAPLEKKTLTKEEVAAWPAVPPYKVGDEVAATGEWNTSSPHGESNTEGLLIYTSMTNVTQNWTAPAPVEVAAPVIRAPAH